MHKPNNSNQKMLGGGEIIIQLTYYHWINAEVTNLQQNSPY